MNPEAVSLQSISTAVADSEATAGVRKQFLLVGIVFLVSRLALLWYNDAEFTDAYEFIAWSFSTPSKRHPLYPMLLQMLSGAMDPIIAGRFLSAISGLLCLGFLIRLARKLYGTHAALLSGLLFTVSPHILFVNTRVLSESLYLAVSLGAILYFVSSLQEGRPHHFALAVFFSGLAVLTRPEGLILLPLVLIAGVWRISKGFWKDLLYAVPALLPWIVYFVWSRFYSNLGYQGEFAFSYRTGTLTKFLTYLFAYIDIYPYSLFTPVFLLAFLGLFLPKPGSGKVWISTLFYLHLAVFTAVTIHQAWSPRFLILPMTLLLVEAGAALTRLVPKFSARVVHGAAFIVIVSSLLFSALALYLQKETYADIKQSALFIRDHAKGGRVFSDELIKVTYYSRRSVIPYHARGAFTVGDIITLHSFHTPLVAELQKLAQRYQLEVLFTSESKITPVLANTLLEEQRTNLPIALTERFREQKFYSAVARVRSVKSQPKLPGSP